MATLVYEGIDRTTAQDYSLDAAPARQLLRELRESTDATGAEIAVAAVLMEQPTATIEELSAATNWRQDDVRLILNRLRAFEHLERFRIARGIHTRLLTKQGVIVVAGTRRW